MTNETKENIRRVLRDIGIDQKADASNFEGQPFNGRTVAEYFGNQGAAIAALASIIFALLDELPSPKSSGGPTP